MLFYPVSVAAETHSMKQNVSSEADSYLAGQQTARIFCFFACSLPCWRPSYFVGGSRIYSTLLDSFNFFVWTWLFLRLALYFTVPWFEYGTNIYYIQVH
jgi:hypothetical protein